MFKRISNILLIIVLLAANTPSGFVYAQQSLSITEQQSFVEKIKEWRQTNSIKILDDEHQPKCGLSLAFEILHAYPNMSLNYQKTISQLLEPPYRQTNKSLGFFTVYYDTIGYHVPSLLTPSTPPRRMLSDTNYVKNHSDSMRVITEYVDSTLHIFNSVWKSFVDVMGYMRPPFESGYDKYNIVLTELGGGLYGQTVPNGNPINPGEFPPRYSSYIEIDNDFIAVYPSSRGLPGLRVTAAHEFHHAIQLGSYGYREADRYFYEITSTWMEDVLYNGVNDYYQYIKNSSGAPRGHFAEPNKSFLATDGLIEYSRAIWGKFVEEKYSASIMRRAWEGMRSFNSIKSLDNALIEVNSTLRIAFVEFAKWNYFTAGRSLSGKYYSEASGYPLIKERAEIEMTGTSRTYNDSTETFSSIYLSVLFNETPVQIITTNINQDAAEAGNKDNKKYSLLLRTSQLDGYRELVSGLFAKINVGDPQNWTFTSVGQAPVISSLTVYPNPYVIDGGGKIHIELPPAGAKLYIYSSDMSLVFSKDFPSDDKEQTIQWDAKDDNGIRITSGIYFYVAVSNNKEYVGKIAVVRK
ncbi:MAG: hypothetical protein QME58_02560 [Bacteroidota bacterium]|nr:hypothetical protein [Bacteroidota bacterium]